MTSGIKVKEMKRREFIKYSGVLTSVSLISMLGIPSCNFNQPKNVGIPDMKLYWQKWKTKRPYAPDIDGDGLLWYGRDSLFCSNLETNTTEKIDTTYLEGNPLSSVFCYGNKIYIAAQKSPFIYVYYKDTKDFKRFSLPEPESNIWYGVKVDNGQKLYLYARNLGKLIVWDTEIDKGIAIPFPDNIDLWSGFYVEQDQAIYSFTLENKPSRLVRFDLKKQKYDAIIYTPDPNLEITGVNTIGDTLYCADRFTGRIFPFNYVDKKWSEPVVAPGIGKEFGFVGVGCSYNGLALYCLSTYKGKMKWDFDKNKYISSEDENIGVDGNKHHFLNKFLVYDPRQNKFEFLEAEENGRYPLLCYSIVHNDKLIITGFDIWNKEEMLPDMEKEGELLVFHN